MRKRSEYTKSTVWNVALYAAEAWTLTKASKKLLEACKMWTWRRMLKISWTEKVTNEQVFVHANDARSISKMIWCRKHRCVGMFSGMTTYSMTLSKGKCWARYVLGWNIYSQTDQGGDRIASENACQKPAENSRRLKKEEQLSRLQFLLPWPVTVTDWLAVAVLK